MSMTETRSNIFEAGRSVLARLPLMSTLSEDERRLVGACFEPLTFKYGESVVVQGEAATAYFVIVSGRARVLTTGQDGREVALNMLTAGDAFGELALIAKSPRSATVRAATPLDVLRLDRSVFLALVSLHPRLGQAFSVDARAMIMGDFLQLHPCFHDLPRARMVDLVSHTDELLLGDHESLKEPGDRPGGLNLVGTGRLVALDDHGAELCQLHAGDVFGGPEDEHLTFSALGDAQVLHIQGSGLRALAIDHPMVVQRLADRAALVRRRRRSRSTAVDVPALLSATTEEGLLAEIAETDTGQYAPPTGIKRRRRMKLVEGYDAMDCGVSCVATLCRYYGYNVSMPAIRTAVGTALDGTSLRGIIRGGAEIGIEFRAIKTSLDRLARMPLPVILHWGGNHWVVLYELKRGRARIADPAVGLRAVTEGQLAESWSGYVAIPHPTARLATAPRGGLTLGWLLPFVRPHRLQLVAAAGLALLGTGLQTALPVLTQVVVDGLLHGRGIAYVSLVMGAMVAALLAAVGATILQRRTLARVAVMVDGKALDFLAQRLLRLPLAYFQVRRTADIQRRLEGVRQIRRVLVEDGVVGVTAAFQLLVALVVMSYYSWVAGLMFVAILPLYVLLMRYSSRRLKPALDALEEAFGRYQGKQLDSIRGIEVVKASAAEDGFRQTLLHEFEKLQGRLYRRDVTVLVYEGLVSLASLAIVALFLWIGALLVVGRELTVGGLVAINALVLLANGPLRTLLSLWDQLQYVGVLLARVQEVHQQEPEQEPDASLAPVAELAGHVRIREVSFHHAISPERKILDRISLDVPAGSTVAFVGRSGSGKSTLLRCMAGLLRATEGSVEFDGTDLRQLDLGQLRSRVGFVLQEPYLFDATIAENIAFGHLPVDLARVHEAAEIANASSFIERLPLGYQTRVGDSGLRISTGQAQRISIARAIYHRPAVLLLDEPTSALDSEAERAVKEGVQRMLHGRTAFIVAHRLSTIRDADLICVLDGGRLVEQGTHDELLQREGLYAYLYSQQLAA